MNSFSELNEGFTSEIFEMAGKLASNVFDVCRFFGARMLYMV